MTVYFIEAIAPSHRIKIGNSCSPHSRAQLLCNRTGATFDRFWIANSDKIIEKSLHEKFAHHRLEGEWFDAAPEIFEFIEQNASIAAIDWLHRAAPLQSWKSRTVSIDLGNKEMLAELDQAVAREAVKKKIRASRSGFMRRALLAHMRKFVA